MFLSSAYAQDAAAAPAPGGGFPSIIIMYLLIGLVFYFLLIRPQSQARKKHLEKVTAVKRGDEVVTAGGLLGKVTKSMDGDECLVEIADGVQVRVVKATLTDVRGKGDASAKTAAKPAAKTKA